MSIFFVDGEFVQADQAVIPVQDLAVLRGFGVFDFLRTYKRKPFYLKEHVQRLMNSAAGIGLKAKWTEEKIIDAVLVTLEKNPELDEANVRIVLTGGDSDDTVLPSGNSRLIIMVTPLKRNPASWYCDGVKIMTTPAERFHPDAKSTNYLAGVMAMQEARSVGAVEAVYVDCHKHILEGTTSNFFCYIDGVLITPGEGVLSGITRKTIAKLAKPVCPFVQRQIHVDEISRMSECFISASNKEIVPVVQIDDAIIGNGKPGSMTKAMMALFRDFTQAYGEQD